jgi:hypothetical protein
VLRARTALEAADPASARRWLAEADGVLLRARDAHLTALALEQSARCALFEGDLAEAERLASAAARSFEAVGYAEGLVASRLTLGRVRAAEGDAVGAATSYRDAAARAGELAHPAGVAEGLEHLAGLTAASGDPAAAARLLGHAEGLRQRTGTPRTPLQDRGVRTLTAALDTALGDERERLATAGRDQALTELLERVP